MALITHSALPIYTEDDEKLIDKITNDIGFKAEQHKQPIKIDDAKGFLERFMEDPLTAFEI